MIYLIIYVVIALLTTALLYGFCDFGVDQIILSIFGGILFPLTIIILVFMIPIKIVNYFKYR